MIHTVKQGEYLSKISRQYGFADWKTIWDDAQNVDLKKKRQNPNVLYPGDKLVIPDREQKEVPASTEERHKFQVKRNKLKLCLVLEDIYEKPIANTKCELILDGKPFNLTTDGKGKIEKEIMIGAEVGFLIIKNQETALPEAVLPLRIGHLDPVEEESGQKARLNNLGYFASTFEGNEEADNRQMFLSAIEEFQCDHGLTVDGICGPQTQAKLKDIHGC